MGDSQDALALFADLDDLWRDIIGTHGERSIEAYDTLFGPRNLHADLEALGARRPDFQRRFTGHVRTIADFAVTSGHEALAIFAERVAGHTRVRKTIPRLRGELDQARQHGDAGAVAKLEMDLGVACGHFARCLQSAFKGWDENRAWIDRSLREEAAAKPAAWDPRDAIHRATMAVYDDLGSLVSILRKHRYLDVALHELDEYAPPGSAPECGDPQGIADLKQAAARLRLSLATAKRIRDTNRPASHVGGSGGHFGAISTTSHHDAFLEAAAEVLEPDKEGAWRAGRIARQQSASGIIRRKVVAAAMDPVAWARIREDLEHEYARAMLLPPQQSDRSEGSASEVTPRDPSENTNDTVHVNMLVRDGKTWKIRFEGQERSLPDLVGFTYLQKLLSNPHVAFSPNELHGGGPVHLTAVHEIADATALASLKRELREAKEELEEAKRDHDQGRYEPLHQKIEILQQELSQATVRGRSRAMPDDLNKSRSAVGRAIASALKEIEAVLPAAHVHLKATLRTPSGRNVSYRPDGANGAIAWLVNTTATPSDAAGGLLGTGESL